jgi:hypothetical protein
MICTDCNTSQYRPEKCTDCNKSLPYADHDPDGMKFWTGCRNIFLVAALLFFLCMVIFWLPSCANANVNIELSGGVAQFQAYHDGEFWQGKYETHHGLNTPLWSVGLTADIYQAKHWGVKAKAAYIDIGTVRGNNRVCGPDNCDKGLVPVELTGWMNITQKTRGATLGLIGEVKIGSFSFQPEIGLYYMRTFLSCFLVPEKDFAPATIEQRNEEIGMYSGLRIEYKTKYGAAYVGARYYPHATGELIYGKDPFTYEFGIAIPIWNY